MILLRRLAALAGPALLGAVIVAYVLYPVGAMLAESLRGEDGFSFRHYASLLDPGNRGNVEAVINSVLVSLLSVAGSAVVGTLLAVVVTQLHFPLRKFVGAVAVLPVALPPLVGVIAFLFVFGDSGIIPRVLKDLLGTATSPFGLDGIPAIVVVHVYSFSVYFYLLVSEALRTMDGSLIEAASTLGARPWKIFLRVILPGLRPALTGASVLTFMASMASFSAPLLFAGSRRFVTLQIYSTKLNGELDLAAAQAVLLTTVSLTFFVFLALSGRSRHGVRRTRGAPRVGVLGVSALARGILLALGGMVVTLQLLPILTILLISFAREGSWTWQILPMEYTLENYRLLFSDPAVLVPVENSVLMALLAGSAALCVGVAAAVMVARIRSGAARTLADVAVTAAYAIPGTVVAIGLLLAFSTPSIMTGSAVLVGTFWILPLAYAVRTYPLVVRSTAASLARIDDSLMEAAESFGASRGRTFRRVTLPLVLPGIISGLTLVVIAALGEFVSSVLLYSYSSRPIAVEILAQMRGMNFGAAAAYSVFLLVVILGVVGIAGQVTRRSAMESTPLTG